MGCVVNGPGEARHADIGITGAGTTVLIFKHGTIVRHVDIAHADEAFEATLNELLAQKFNDQVAVSEDRTI